VLGKTGSKYEKLEVDDTSSSFGNDYQSGACLLWVGLIRSIDVG